MNRILVIGSPGSGKSTFSRKLSGILEIPLTHLDMLFWNEDKTTVDNHIFLKRLDKALSGESWIIDGNYLNTLEIRLKKSDTVFFLDYTLETCLEGVKSRIGKPRLDMPWIETEEDPGFTDYIIDFNTTQIPKIKEILEENSDKKIVTFKDRKDAILYLNNLKKDK